MEDIYTLFAQFGLLAVFVVVLAKQLGAPVPAMPVLLMAGAAAADNGVFAAQALALATLASMLADSLWYFAGRHYGRRVLTLLCRISISPDSCVRKNELSFARRGEATLVIAKFVPALDTIAPPLAGAMGMGVGTFTVFNAAGAALWAGSGIAGGLIFHNQIGRLLQSLGDLGYAALWVIAGLLGLYVAWRAWRRWRETRSQARIPRVRPDQLAELLDRGAGPIIIDVRSALPGLPKIQRIPGARRIDLATIEKATSFDWTDDARIVTYCDCPNDVSAGKAAHLLAQRGLNASVLSGGIEAWVEAGYRLESA